MRGDTPYDWGAVGGRGPALRRPRESGAEPVPFTKISCSRSMNTVREVNGRESGAALEDAIAGRLQELGFEVEVPVAMDVSGADLVARLPGRGPRCRLGRRDQDPSATHRRTGDD